MIVVVVVIAVVADVVRSGFVATLHLNPCCSVQFICMLVHVRVLKWEESELMLKKKKSLRRSTVCLVFKFRFLERG